MNVRGEDRCRLEIKAESNNSRSIIISIRREISMLSDAKSDWKALQRLFPFWPPLRSWAVQPVLSCSMA